MGLLLFAHAAWLHGNEDLWNDEIYSLRFFVFKGLSVVLTDYHVPNNHIFANVLHWLWVQLPGCGDMGALLDDAWRLRLLPGLLSAVTAGLLWQAASKNWGRHAGGIAVLLLLSGITFGNFAFQVRGYALSMLAGSGLLYGALNLFQKKHISFHVSVLVALSTAVLLYTIPSNLYFVLSVGAMALLTCNWREPIGRAAALWFGGAMVAGALIAIAWYVPVLDRIFNNEYVAGSGAFRGEHFGNMATTLEHFFSWCWMLLLLLLPGWWFAVQEAGLRRRQAILLAGVFFLPFLFSALRGDNPPLRAFLVQLPAFVLLLTLGWISATDKIGMKSLWQRVAMVLPAIYCLLCYPYAVYKTRQTLEQGLDKLVRYQDLNYNYYQYLYAPNRELDLFRQKYASATLIIETSEPYDVPIYAQHKKVRAVPLDSIQKHIERDPVLYISTMYPRNFIREMQKLTPAWDCSYLQPEVRYPRIVVCRRK